MGEIIKPVIIVNVPNEPTEETVEGVQNGWGILKDSFNVIVTYDPAIPFSIKLITNDPNFKIIDLCPNAQ